MMIKKNAGTIGLLVDKANEIIPYLNDKNYDFGDISDELIVKFNKLEEEKIRQENIMNMVKEKTRDIFAEYFRRIGKFDEFVRNFDDYFSSIFRIENHQNYYLVWFYGAPHMEISFIFDKGGNLLFDNGSLHGLDNENFFVIRYESKEMIDKMYHYQLRDGSFKLINTLDNVTDIDYSDFFKSDRLVICSCNSDSLLYNYSDAEVVIPSFSGVYRDLGNLERYSSENSNSIRMVKKIFVVENFKSVMVSKE